MSDSTNKQAVADLEKKFKEEQQLALLMHAGLVDRKQKSKYFY